MFRFKHVRAALLVAVIVFAPDFGSKNAAQVPAQQAGAMVHLRWGPRIGVSRYRLQLALDSRFSDIVFDRVIAGTETEVKDLAPGRYFWRVAPLTASLGAFSSTGVIEVRAVPAQPDPRPTEPKTNQVTASPISTGGGWRAALGEVSRPTLARLRSPEKPDVVVTTAAGVVFALDAPSGVALWSFRPPNQNPGAALTNTMLAVPTRARLDNLFILSGPIAIQIEGSTGRELWRATLPGPASTGAVFTDRTGSRLIVVDNSRQRLFVLSDVDGSIVSQINLPGRAIGAPLVLNDQGKPWFALAYDSGAIEIRDLKGVVVHSGSAASLATTAPIFVRGRRGDLILVGTKDGLTAMTADDLRPLGRMSIKDDAPRGALVAQDLDGDGVPEVIMSTERRRLIALNASDGKIIWDVAADRFGEAVAFADLNRDQVLDVLVSGGQRFALALSGKDGSEIWKDAEAQPPATNHTGNFASRHLLALPYGSGVLLIAPDSNRTGLRAIAFANAEIRPSPR